MKRMLAHPAWGLVLLALGCDSTAPRTGVKCTEARFEGSVYSLMPPRPLWVDAESFHVVHPDSQLGIVHRTLSRQTGREQSLVDYRKVLEEERGSEYAQIGMDGVAAGPDGTLAVAFGYKDKEYVRQDRMLLSRGAGSRLWTPPWKVPSPVWGLGWDGEDFTASLLDFDARWGWARFSVEGEMLSQVEVVGQAEVLWGEYDSETDKQTGTTVFVGASSLGIYMVGRKGRETSLTAPADYWRVSASDGGPGTFGSKPAVALGGDTALVAWVSGGLAMREVALGSGRTSALYHLDLDPANNPIKRTAAARAGDRWVVVTQDELGLLLVELQGGEMRSRRLLRHAPPPCASCPSSDLRFTTTELSVVADGDEAWAGLVDGTVQGADRGVLYPTYRILPLRDGCEYKSLASE